MVLQGKPEENKKWSIPSGGKETGESFIECCVREVYEETGYVVEVINQLKVKRGKSFNIPVEVHYFLAKVVGGEPTIHDPDELIYDIDWKSAEELATLDMAFPEDRNLLLGYIEQYSIPHNI